MFINRLKQVFLQQQLLRRKNKISSSTTTSSKSLGDALELRVARIAQLLGYSNIRRNVILIDSHGNRSEADVVFGRFFPTYVECKNYSQSGNSVGLEEVAKWRMVLELNKIPLNRGLFVTTSRFSPRARTIGIKCLDDDELDQWERHARRVFYLRRLVLYLISIGFISITSLILAVAAAPLLVEKFPFLLKKSLVYERLLKQHHSRNSKRMNEMEALNLWVMNELAVMRLGFIEFRDAVNAAVEETLGGGISDDQHFSSSASLRSSIPSFRSFFEEDNDDSSARNSSVFETLPLPFVLFIEFLLQTNREFMRGWRWKEILRDREEKEDERKKKTTNATTTMMNVLSEWSSWFEGSEGGGGGRRKDTNSVVSSSSLSSLDWNIFMTRKEKEEEEWSFLLGSQLREVYEKVRGLPK